LAGSGRSRRPPPPPTAAAAERSGSPRHPDPRRAPASGRSRGGGGGGPARPSLYAPSGFDAARRLESGASTPPPSDASTGTMTPRSPRDGSRTRARRLLSRLAAALVVGA